MSMVAQKYRRLSSTAHLSHTQTLGTVKYSKLERYENTTLTNFVLHLLQIKGS